MSNLACISFKDQSTVPFKKVSSKATIYEAYLHSVEISKKKHTGSVFSTVRISLNVTHIYCQNPFDIALPHQSPTKWALPPERKNNKECKSLLRKFVYVI